MHRERQNIKQVESIDLQERLAEKLTRNGQGQDQGPSRGHDASSVHEETVITVLQLKVASGERNVVSWSFARVRNWASGARSVRPGVPACASWNRTTQDNHP